MTDATEATVVNIDGDPTALYRLYGANDTLLYIGVTSNIPARFAQHAGDKSWWPEVTRKTAVLYGSRPAALAAEDKAIRLELPVHNVRQASPRPIRNVRQASPQTEGERAAALEQVRAVAALAATERDTYREAMDRLRAAVRAADRAGDDHNEIVRAAGGGMSRRKVYEAFKTPAVAGGDDAVEGLTRFESAEIVRRET